MIDGIVSQQDSFGLYPVFEEAAEEFLKCALLLSHVSVCFVLVASKSHVIFAVERSKITWGETFAIARKYFL